MLRNTSRDATYIDPSSASTYSNNNDVQFNQAKSFIDANRQLIKAPVLDLGCGDGKVTAYIANEIAKPVIGVDISAERVNFANTSYANAQLKFLAGNIICVAEIDSLKSQQFATITSFNALHHIPKDLQMLAFSQARRLLQEDGVAIFMVGGRSPDMHNAIIETSQSEAWKSHFKDFSLEAVRTYETPEYYSELCHRTGFETTEVSACTDGGKELSFDGFKNFLKGWLPHLAHLKALKCDDSAQDKFLTDVATLYYAKMKKSHEQAVNPVITQNRIMAFPCSISLFNKARYQQTKSTNTILESKLRR